MILEPFDAKLYVFTDDSKKAALLVNTILGEQSKENNKHSKTTFELPKEYERFDGLGVPVGLTLNCNSEKSIYGGGHFDIKEVDSDVMNIELFTCLFEKVCMGKSKKNVTKKIRKK